MQLLGHEIERLPVLPLSLSHPRNERLSALCRRSMEQPDIHQTIDD